MSGIWHFLTTGSNWGGRLGIWHRLISHLWVSLLAVGAGAIVAIPTGIATGHHRKAQVAATAVANVGRAIPSLAILYFVVAANGGIGFAPTFIAMFALAVPAIFVATTTGVGEVDHGIVDAGVGLGMRPSELLRRIELPLASPLILSGLRIATSQVIATATLGAFVGYNSLGGFITVGRANGDNGMLYGGVVLVVGLALIAELGFRTVQRVTTPWLANAAGRGPSR
jgi:osmoprotectant transport system permease protein